MQRKRPTSDTVARTVETRINRSNTQALKFCLAHRMSFALAACRWPRNGRATHAPLAVSFSPEDPVFRAISESRNPFPDMRRSRRCSSR
jgi:hypothetical protein